MRSIVSGTHAPARAEEAELEAVGAVVEAYEQRTYPLPNPDPIEAIKFRMDQQGLTSADLLPIFGTRRRVSEVLNLRKRPLTLDMIRQLHYRLGIPLQSLVTPQARVRHDDRVDVCLQG